MVLECEGHEQFDYKKFLETRNKTLLIRIIGQMLEDFKRIDKDEGDLPTGEYSVWIKAFEDIEKRRVKK